ncbi:MAG: RDD family protein [Promethearchaeota archaeon]
MMNDEDTSVLQLRVLAYVIDFFLILMFGAIGFVLIILFLALVGFPTQYVQPLFQLYSQMNVYLFPLPYFIIQEKVISTTLGKKLCNLEIVADTTTGVTYKEAIIRNLSKIRPEFLFIDLLLGFLINRADQRFLEYISNTTVFYSDKFQNFTKSERETLRVFKLVLSILGFFSILLMMFATYVWPILVTLFPDLQNLGGE